MNQSVSTLLHYYYIHAELGFFLNGTLLPNNSIVLLNDIGKEGSALYCLTDRENCCTGKIGMRPGLWKFPNGSNVSNDKYTDIYIRRGSSSIRLNRERNIMAPTGVYKCLMPNSGATILETLLIGIYSDSQGRVIHIAK